MKIVIVGYTGFIGNIIYQKLERTKEYHLTGLSTKEIDLTEEKSQDTLSKILSPKCVVIMCAGVKKQLGDNLETFEKNSAIINNFSKAVIKMPPRKIIFFSSASVYGEDVAYFEEITEKTPVQLKTYYGIAKYNAECLLEKVCSDLRTHLVILRPPLIYGKDDLSRGYGPTGFTYKAMNNEEIVLWGDGSEFREFIYVDDIGAIVSQLINLDVSGIFNLVSGTSYTYNDIIDSLTKIIGPNIKVTSRRRTKGKVNHYYSNFLIQRAIKELKFTQLKDGLINMYESINN